MKQNRILVWNDYRAWRAGVLRCVPEYLNVRVLDCLRQHPPRHFVSDDLSYVDEAIRRTTGDDVQIKTLLAKSLSKRFDFIRAFHGCRPVDLQSYRERGIIPSEISLLEAQALVLFGDTARVRERIAELRLEEDGYAAHNNLKVFFCLTMEELLKDCGQYLLYGSEYLLCVANALGAGHILRRRGTATIIECNVPTEDIPVEYLEELCGRFLAVILEKFCTGRTELDGDAGFHIFKPLAPENIVAFHHPKGIPNPHNLMRRED